METRLTISHVLLVTTSSDEFIAYLICRIIFQFSDSCNWTVSMFVFKIKFHPRGFTLNGSTLAYARTTTTEKKLLKEGIYLCKLTSVF